MTVAVARVVAAVAPPRSPLLSRLVVKTKEVSVGVCVLYKNAKLKCNVYVYYLHFQPKGRVARGGVRLVVPV
jgi:hypothetical protein